MNKYNLKRFSVVLSTLILIMITITVMSINIGVYPIPIDRVISTLFGFGEHKENLVVWMVRLPRTGVAVLVGMCLAMAGAVMQGVTRNPLATPSMIGVTSGASLGMLLVVYMHDIGLGVPIARPIAALLGGFGAFGIVYTLALKHSLSPVKLILNGIAINSCIGALSLIISRKLSTNAYTTASITLGGSLTAAGWDTIRTGFLIALPCVLFVMYKAYTLNILNLGEEMSIGLGINLKKERQQLLFVTIILSSVSAYVAGGIGFVGMIAPHIAKRIVGPNFKLFLPVSVFIGANLVIIADVVSRLLEKSNSFIPVGTIISLLGAPYLLYLLFAEDR